MSLLKLHMLYLFISHFRYVTNVLSQNCSLFLAPITFCSYSKWSIHGTVTAYSLAHQLSSNLGLLRDHLCVLIVLFSTWERVRTWMNNQVQKCICSQRWDSSPISLVFSVPSTIPDEQGLAINRVAQKEPRVWQQIDQSLNPVFSAYDLWEMEQMTLNLGASVFSPVNVVNDRLTG